MRKYFNNEVYLFLNRKKFVWTIILTESLVNPRTVSTFAPAVLLEAWQSTDMSETKLLTDEKEEYGQQDDKDAHHWQEAHRLRSDWWGNRHTDTNWSEAFKYRSLIFILY